MKLYIFPLTVVDCTADPHPVEFAGLDEALDAIYRVCKSDLVQAIRCVRLILCDADREVKYESDYYSPEEREGATPASHPEARDSKYSGLYFSYEAGVPAGRHIPPGLLGVKEASKLALQNPERLVELSVGVVWSFAEGASCSDYIALLAEGCGTPVVDFSNQDWWTSLPGYREHCRKLGELLGAEIEAYDCGLEG